MRLRIDEPVGAQMRFMSKDDKELLMAQRNVDYARETGTLSSVTYDLITLGQFDEAIALGSQEAAEIKAAVDRPDNEFCDCEAALGKEYQTARKVYSERHGKVVPVLRCHLCGNLNATDFIPSERHERIDELRAAADSIVAPLLSSQGSRRQVKVIPDGAIHDTHKTLQ